MEAAAAAAGDRGILADLVGLAAVVVVVVEDSLAALEVVGVEQGRWHSPTSNRHDPSPTVPSPPPIQPSSTCVHND